MSLKYEPSSEPIHMSGTMTPWGLGFGCRTVTGGLSWLILSASASIACTGGGKACLLIRKHDHFTPTREIRQHVRALGMYFSCPSLPDFPLYCLFWRAQFYSGKARTRPGDLTWKQIQLESSFAILRVGLVRDHI